MFQMKHANPERRMAEGHDILLFLRSQRTYKVTKPLGRQIG